MKHRLSRAFTLVEVVITMALVIISTVFAITVSVYSTSQANRMNQEFRASNFAADVLSCYRIARQQDTIDAQSEEFETYLRFYTDYTAIDIRSDEYDNFYYSFELDNLFVDASIYYTTGVFNINIARSAEGKPFYSFSYNTELNMVIGG